MWPSNDFKLDKVETLGRSGADRDVGDFGKDLVLVNPHLLVNVETDGTSVDFELVAAKDVEADFGCRWRGQAFDRVESDTVFADLGQLWGRKIYGGVRVEVVAALDFVAKCKRGLLVSEAKTVKASSKTNKPTESEPSKCRS